MRRGHKPRLAVVMGGVSEERNISLKSGKAIVEALAEKRYEVFAVDLTEANIERIQEIAPDVAFIALHGRFGEDGAIQALLDEKGIPYTGSDSRASHAGMDKMASKCFFITHDVPTPPFRLVTTMQQWEKVDASIAEVGLPLVVKPLRQGSSIGVSIARDAEDVAIGLARAFKYGHQAILERYINGREFTVGVLGDTALPVIEIRTPQPFFNADAKYLDDATEYILQPENLAPELYEKIQAIALNAHHAIDCRHFSRVDMMLETDGSPYVLEANTIPGFTARSLLPMAARQAGLSFPDLCERIVEMAMAPRSASKVGIAD